jgi:outer membrane protein OmpA-like peptidoglycan-associated protein
MFEYLDQIIKGLKTFFLNIIVLIISLTGNSQTFTLTDTTFEVGDKYRIYNIRYGFDGDRLPDDSKQTLDSIADFLIFHPELQVEFGSFTDSRGPDQANLKMTQNRAEWCVNYLISKGVKKELLTAKGYGESEPIIPEEEINKYKLIDKKEYERLHSKNRRNMLKILKIDTL